jgi:hypothetical protein
MGAPLLGKHFAELQSAPTSAIAVALVGSLLGQLAALVQASPLWVYVLAAVAPWIPILILELVWTYRHYRWLAVFCVLIITQSAYLLEQVARIVQLRVLGRAPDRASGIFGALGIDQLQLVWTTWAVLALLLLVSRFRRNAWLWATLGIAVIDGLVPHAPPELRLAISALEIAALNLAFATQLNRTYDAWLARAFPDLPERALIDATAALQELRLRPGERLQHFAERVYIVTRGQGQLLREGPGGHEILLGVLSPGQVVRESGTLQAETALELLALPVAAL